MAFRNIYTFGPTFRAENSNTTRHAAEFWMIEPEMAFADLNDNMEIAEDMLKYIIQYVTGKRPRGNGILQQLCGQGASRASQQRCFFRIRHTSHTPKRSISLKRTMTNSHTRYPGDATFETEHERYLTEANIPAAPYS